MGRRTVGGFVKALEKQIKDEQAKLDAMRAEHSKLQETLVTKIGALQAVLDNFNGHAPDPALPIGPTEE